MNQPSDSENSDRDLFNKNVSIENEIMETDPEYSEYRFNSFEREFNVSTKDSIIAEELEDDISLEKPEIKEVPLVNEFLNPELFQEFTFQEKDLGNNQTIFLPSQKSYSSIKNLSDFRLNVICLYVIHNTYENSYYIGKSLNGNKRMLEHSSTLDRGTHVNPGMQADFNNLKKMGKNPYDYFKVCILFKSVVIGRITMAERDLVNLKLGEREIDLIKAYRLNGQKLYNESGFLVDWNTPVSIDDTVFGTVKLAAAHYQIQERTVMSRLFSKDPKWENWVTFEMKKMAKNKPNLKPNPKAVFYNPVTKTRTEFDNPMECYKFLVELEKNLSSEEKAKYDEIKLFVSRRSINRRFKSSNDERFVFE